MMSVTTHVRAALMGLSMVLSVLPAKADTLADALAAAYRNSNLLDQNRALLRAVDEDVQQAFAAIGPVVEFVSTALISTSSSPNYRLSFGIGASATLFDFGRGRRSIDAVQETVLSTRAGLLVVEQNVLFGAAQAYLALFSDLQSVELQNNSVTVIAEQVRAARERFELGDSTRTDVAIAQARLAAARSALAAAQGNAAVARESYNLSVGQYPHGLSNPPRLPRIPGSLAAAQDIARRHHPAIAQAQHQVNAADIAVEIARSQRLGSVTGSLSAEHSITGITGLTDTVRSDITATMRYAVPLYNGGRLNSLERQAIARAQAQRAALHQTVAIVQQAVAANWAQLQVARARLAASDLQIEASQSAYDAVSAEVELGSRTALDLLNAEQELLDARSTRILGAAGVQTASYALLNSMGQMTVEALRLGIPTYDVGAYSMGLRREPIEETPSEQGRRLDRILGRLYRGEGEEP